MIKPEVPLYLGLVHGPVNNKKGEEVVTSVTNLDIHDISRSCKTFGIKNYFLITPIKAQHELVGRILGHWESDKGSDYNPDRHTALSIARLSNSVEEAILEITKLEGKKPLVCVTSALFSDATGSPSDLIRQVNIDKQPLFLLFGTGWGLSASILNLADFRLIPIFGKSNDGYNHLSVRSAVAIYLDRLWGSL